MPRPERPKIYHIAHVDRLASIVADGYLFSDAAISVREGGAGTTIGMGRIKQRRLTLQSHVGPGLLLGNAFRSIGVLGL
jgi:hypothetical protein